jgi:hypothetical protein
METLPPEEVLALAKGHFIALNRRSGARVSGEVF